jgi:hypothetical protein
MYEYFAGVPIPNLVKYSPLPCANPEITELLKSLARGRGAVTFVPAEMAEMAERDLTLSASLWRRRLKRDCGVELNDRESR